MPSELDIGMGAFPCSPPGGFGFFYFLLVIENLSESLKIHQRQLARLKEVRPFHPYRYRAGIPVLRTDGTSFVKKNAQIQAAIESRSQETQQDLEASAQQLADTVQLKQACIRDQPASIHKFLHDTIIKEFHDTVQELQASRLAWSRLSELIWRGVPFT